MRLANKLVDWMIDVKTSEQFEEMDIAKEARSRAESIFHTDDSYLYEDHDGESAPTEGFEEEAYADEEEFDLSELPLDEVLIKKCSSTTSTVSRSSSASAMKSWRASRI